MKPKKGVENWYQSTAEENQELGGMKIGVEWGVRVWLESQEMIQLEEENVREEE